MCKTCGCASGSTMQLELQVRRGGEEAGLQELYAKIMGSPGILHVTVDEEAGKLVADFNPQRTSRRDVEAIITQSGYGIFRSQVREPAHPHGVTAFLERIIRK